MGGDAISGQLNRVTQLVCHCQACFLPRRAIFHKSGVARPLWHVICLTLTRRMPSAGEVVMIGLDSLEAAVAASREILAKMKMEYPDLEAYLVLAHRGRQIELTTNPIAILESCDLMIADDAAKRDALHLLAELERLVSAKANQRAVQDLSGKLAARGRELRYIPEIQIEIRFHVLRYALVWALQASPWIDRQLTPQTKASILIVLGTLGELSRTSRTPRVEAPKAPRRNG